MTEVAGIFELRFKGNRSAEARWLQNCLHHSRYRVCAAHWIHKLRYEWNWCTEALWLLNYKFHSCDHVPTALHFSSYLLVTAFSNFSVCSNLMYSADECHREAFWEKVPLFILVFLANYLAIIFRHLGIILRKNYKILCI